MAQKQLTVERGLYNELEQDFHQSLSVEQALLHLNNEGTTTRLPFRPKPGNLYLFFNPRPDDWRADGHKWVNQRTTKLPRSTNYLKRLNPFWVVLGWAYRGLTGGFLLLQNFSVAISVSPHVCFILVLILISVFLR